MTMLSLVKLLLFLAASAGLAYLSRVSLRHPRSHGFYRFFAWEAILALGLLNAEVWFRQPLSWHQLISWPLLVISAFLAIHSVTLLRRVARPDARQDEAPLIGFERTTALVTVGAYRTIRHPLYSSLLFLAWGIFFKAPSWAGGLLALAATLLLVATARAEEAEDARTFGPAYGEYRKRTRMFIPYLF
jgi:protein-S-isoprenylcysteine O-methyltransferase Ste14